MRRRLVALAALGTILLVTAAAGAGWLGREDALEECGAIAVLNGDHPTRVNEVARLRRNGYAPPLWLTNDPRSGDADTLDAGTDSNVQRLLELGVERSAIRVLPGAATSTRVELELVRAAAARDGLPCVVVVTSPWHARRVRATWLWRAPATPRLVLRHARGAPDIGWWAATKELGGAGLALVGIAR